MNAPRRRLSLKKRGALQLYSLKKAVEAHAHELRYLFWEATLRCNLKCLHCGSDCLVDTATPDMPLGDFLKVLDSVALRYDASKIQICITGGEPTLRPDLAQAGEQIRKRGFSWGMVTNGMAMNRQKFRELLGAGLGSMAISLDGLEAEHTWFRGSEHSYKKALGAIQMAAEHSSKMPSFSFDVISCINQRTIGQLDRIKKLLIERKVPRWRLASIFPKGRAVEHPELSLSKQQLQLLMEFIKQTRHEGALNASYSCEGFLGEYELEVRDSPFYCRAGIAIGSVLCDGSISACPSLRHDFIQGSIYRDDFCDVWENRYDRMRKRKWMKTGPCATCGVWKYCQGNGLHLREEHSGRLLFCNYEHACT